MRDKKTNSEFIIDALLTGEQMRSPEITVKVSELANKEVKIQDVASILAKLSNSEKCDLGFLITKTKTDRGYVYGLVKEVEGLTPEDLYGMTRKTGQDRFSIEEAVEKVPELKQYVRPRAPKPPRASRINRESLVQAPRRGRPPASASATRAPEVSDDAMRDIVASFMKEIVFQGGLNVNVNVMVQFKGLT